MNSLVASEHSESPDTEQIWHVRALMIHRFPDMIISYKEIKELGGIDKDR